MNATRLRRMTGGHWLAFYGLVLLGWAALVAMAIPAEFRAIERTYGAALIEALCSPTSGPLGAIAMWLLMSAAMMAPTAIPALATYDELGSSAPTRFGHLLSGYLTVWAGFSILAGLAQVALFQLGLIGALGQSQSILLSSALLIGAGAYQFTTLKEACLSRCRAPLTFFMQHWDEGPWKNGLRLGADCLGCCWALMLLGFVGGVMNLWFMGLAMALMALEKLPDIGRPLTRPLGWVLIAAGTLYPLTSLI